MATQENPLDKLYSVLNRDGLYTKDINSFKQKYSTPQEVEKLYNVVNRDGYYTKDYNSFKEKYFPKSNEVSTQGSKNTSQTSTEPSVISQSNPFGQVKQTAPTIDVPTGKVGSVKVQTGSSKPKSSFIQDIGNATVAGLGQLGNIAASIPSGIIDTYGRMNIANATPVGALGILDDWIKDIKINNDDNLATQYLGTILNTVKGSSKDLSKTLTPTMDAQQLSDEIGAKGIPQEYNPFNPNNEVVKYFREVQKSNHDKANASYKGGILEAIKNGEYGTAGKLATLGAVESLPLTLGMIASRGAGLSGNQLLTALGVGTSEAEYQQLKENNPNIDKNVLLLNAQLTGLGEAGSELLGTNLLYDQAKNLFRKGAKDEAEKLLKTGLKSFLDNMFKKSFVGASALSESSGEMVNQVWKNAIDKWTNVDPQRDYTDGVIDAGIVSLLSSGGIATGAKLLSKVVNPKVKQELKEQTTQINDLSTDVNNVLLPEQTRGELLKQTVKTTERINNKIDKELETFNQLTEQDQKKVISINDKIDVIDEALSAEQITLTTKTTLEEQKIKLEEQLSEIKPPKIETTEEKTIQNEPSEKEYQDVVDELDRLTETFVKNGIPQKQAEFLALDSITKEQRDILRKSYEKEVSTRKEENPPKQKIVTPDGFQNRIHEGGIVLGQPTETSHITEKDYTYRSIGQSEIDAIKNTGGVFSKEGKAKGGNTNVKYWSRGNGKFFYKEGQNVIRVKNENISEDKVVDANNLEIWDNKTNKFIPFNKTTSEEVVTPNKEVKVTEEIVKPKYTIKGEQITPKIQEETTNAVQKRTTEEEIPRIGETRENITESSERVRPSKQREEITQESKEEVEVSGIKKSLVSQEVVDKVDFEKITDKEMQGLGKGLVESGEVKPKEIVDSIAGGDRRALQPKEVVSLIYYKTDLDNQYRDLLKQKNELLTKGESVTSVDAQLADVQQEINNFEVTSVITANQQSLAFRLRKGLLDKDYNYATQVERYKATNKGVIEPEVEAKFKEYDKQLRELKEQIVEAQKRAQIAEENSAVNNIIEDVKRETPTKRKRAEANLKKAKDEFSQFLKKSRGQANSFADVATFVTQASKLIKAYADLGIVKVEEIITQMRKDYGDKFVDDNIENISKAYDTANLDRTKPYVVDGNLVVPNSYIRSVVESGVTDINTISEQVLTEVKKDLPNATIREVRDAITRYGKTINQTADDITKQINQAKRLGRLYSKLEDLQNGLNTSKTQKRTVELSQQERNLKKEIKDLENALPKTEEQLEADNAKRIQAKKRYYERFIEEKQQRLKDKNFKPKPKSKPIIPDDELSRLEAKANEIRAKYDEAHFENEQLNRPLGKKIYDESLEWLTGLTRALQAGLDLSAFGVQLAVYTSSTSPSKVLYSVKESLKFLSSEKYEKEFFARLQTHPLYPIMKASGLALQYPNSKLGSRDYQLSGSAINKVYNALVFPLKFVNNKLYERATTFNPYRATERAFTGAIDTARIQMFTEFVKDLEQNGISFENNPEQYKIAADATNNLTFRGKLGRLEGVSRELAVVFFAPRKVAASLALVNPVYYAQVGMGSKVVAKRLMLKMATFISMATMLTLLVKATQDSEDEDSNPDVFNTYSSDFMKLRIGNTRIDMFGGLNQNIVFFARQIMGLYKKTSSYKTEELGGAPFIPTRLGLVGQFTKNKLAPTTSLLTTYLDQSKGREVDWDTEAVESVAPMWTASIKELYKEHPTEIASFLTFMSLIGQSMNTYGTAEFLDKDKDRKYIDLLGRKNGAFQNRTRASIKIIDDGSGEERGIDKVEYEVYKKEFGEYVKSDLKSRYKELDEMTIPEFEKELKKIKKNAKEFAEFKVANSVGDLGKINQTIKGKQVNYELTPEQIRQRLKYNDSYINRFGNKSMTVRTKKFMQRDKLNKEQAEKEALIEMNKAANKYSEKMLFRDYRAKKIKLEIKE